MTEQEKKDVKKLIENEKQIVFLKVEKLIAEELLLEALRNLYKEQNNYYIRRLYKRHKSKIKF